MKKILLLIALASSMSAAPGQSYISSIYCKVLGNADLKPAHTELVRRALKDHGVSNSESVPVKKMNGVGSLVALMPVASFTAFGLWFDEKNLDESTEAEKTFQIYHEAAHYAKRHHQQVLFVAAATSALTGAGATALKNILVAQNNPYALSLTLCTTAAAVVGLYVGLLPYMVKRQEKEADLAASARLIACGDGDIVESRIQDLRKSKPASGNIWWYSPTEQAQYLQKEMNKTL